MTLSDERIQEIADIALRSVGMLVCNRSFVVAAIRQAIAELHAWRPIETAPKDGRQILAIDIDGQFVVVEYAIWADGTGMWEIGHNEGRTYCCGRPLTGWQPLPQPPETPK